MTGQPKIITQYIPPMTRQDPSGITARSRAVALAWIDGQRQDTMVFVVATEDTSQEELLTKAGDKLVKQMKG